MYLAVGSSRRGEFQMLKLVWNRKTVANVKRVTEKSSEAEQPLELGHGKHTGGRQDGPR